MRVLEYPMCQVCWLMFLELQASSGHSPTFYSLHCSKCKVTVSVFQRYSMMSVSGLRSFCPHTRCCNTQHVNHKHCALWRLACSMHSMLLVCDMLLGHRDIWDPWTVTCDCLTACLFSYKQCQRLRKSVRTLICLWVIISNGPVLIAWTAVWLWSFQSDDDLALCHSEIQQWAW